MIELDDLLPPKRQASEIDPDTLVAAPGFAPEEWQSETPPEAYGDLYGHKPPVEDSEDLQRVLAVPRREPPAPGSAKAEALVALMTRRYRLDGTDGPAAGPCACRAEFGRDCILRLNFAQAWSLYEIGLYGGVTGFLQVGSGKTILEILAPLALKDCKTALLLVPVNLVAQLVREYRLLSQHFRVPSLVVHAGKGAPPASIRPGEPALHVLPYSRLSNEKSTVFIERLDPDVIIADEAHSLRSFDSVRTGRVLRRFAARPDTRFLCWSGSMTDASVKDYGHLLMLSLRERSPLPLRRTVLDEWAGALDATTFPRPEGALKALCRPGEHFRSAYRRRLVETPGVITTTGSTIDADLRIVARQAPDIPGDLKRMIQTVRDSWVRPDDEILVTALDRARCLRELAQGVYLKWTFPRGEPQELRDAWFDARKKWRRELREMVASRRPHLDSPLLLARAAMRYHGDVAEPDPDLPVWPSLHWPAWRDIRKLVVPKPVAVRVDDYLARDAARWALENRGIVWYSLVEFGKWVAEISGLPLHGGGPGAGERIARERGDTSIIASVKSHGTGRDGLQHLYDHQLIVSVEKSSGGWQQLLGRLHRQGQKSDRVVAEAYLHTPELRANLRDAIRRSKYVRDTLGEEQKLLSGYDHEEFVEEYDEEEGADEWDM